MPHILLVEDNEWNADMLSRRLSRRGFEVTTVSDGISCIQQVLMNPPDLILMDVSLPDMDGYETTCRLKKDASIRAIPIIALTAHALPGEREKALDAGCNEYEAKPIDLDSLLVKINRLIESSCNPT